MNCHGCKWLDEISKEPPGSGYCCRVARSKDYHTMECAIDCGHRAPQIRRPEDERCELYEAGAWVTRYAPASSRGRQSAFVIFDELHTQTAPLNRPLEGDDAK